MRNPEYAVRDEAVQRENLASILARQVLHQNESVWRPDFLSHELADDIAWEIGARASVEPVAFKGLRSSETGDSYAIRLHDVSNVIELHRR